MPSLLEQLKQHSTLVADTGDLTAIQTLKPEDATTNPSLVLKAVQSGQYDTTVDASLQAATGDCLEDKIDDACDRLAVAMGAAILQHIPGRISTEVNARLSYQRDASIDKARRLVALYEEQGVGRDRILIKLAATWEGIKAAELLEQEGIQCNLTLIFSFAQARACAEAGVFLISPFVGRILDWFKKANPGTEYAPADEPGVLSVASIYQYYKQHGYNTVVMGASFRNSGEILALAGCDRLTISPALLTELSETEGELDRALCYDGDISEPPAAMTEAEYRWALNQDAMATEKLAEGIRGFEKDQRTLEGLLAEKLG
ncbi:MULTISPECIES: transaldolase [unclassified Oceanobacter]|uniref:transaldolase n=1 Tax=unclassified Oceanobacter TaxID=2620260 RepID=UPI00273773C8|nr:MULTISPECIES: transaldolase [unclassified Oceanobacter]MDP2607648.1 transaldolase [Oceanobacter sp. 1_MG-2023]MDP2611168.1 transaldolase [Oceanobacter sp. 2_MG-2023]